MKYKILYIDDEESNLRIFKNTFRREFDIYLANSAKEGIELLKKQVIDLIITDQKMPGMTGIDLLREVQEQFPKIPPHRLMISGFAEPEEIQDAYDQYGLFQFIHKPWNTEDLHTTMYNALNEVK